MHIKRSTVNYLFLRTLHKNKYTMKKIFLNFICLLLSINSWAGNPIKLEKKESADDKRYEIPINDIFIEQERNTLRIFSRINISTLTIIIKNDIGEIVYTNSISIYSDQPFILVLPNMNYGKYTIDLISNEYELNGDFYI